MGGNSFGTLFRITTWGESHGEALGVVIDGCPSKMDLSEEDIQREMDRNFLRCPDRDAAMAMEKKMEEVKRQGDTFRGIVEITVRGRPPGLGEPVFDKLEADLAKALMSIGAVRGVEIGAGFGVAWMFGSQCNDPLGPRGFEKNDAGGILGGISNGADILLRVAVKPLPSTHLEQRTVDQSMRPVSVRIKGRHDVTAIPRINSVCEAMVAIVLADHLLRQKALERS